MRSLAAVRVVTGPIISFGSFQLDSARLQLSEGGIRLDVGARACALLLVLLQRKGEIVSSAELLKAAWPGVTVDEVNVRVHVTALRKVLRDGKGGSQYIQTIPRRGYSFIGQAALEAEAPAAPGLAEPTPPPQPWTSLVGRADAVAQLKAELANRRIVTVVGPGGIGKTSLVLAVASEPPREGDKTCVFVDLSTATNAAHVAESLFVALALHGTPEDLISYIVAALRERKLLLILDNCDQVIDAVAGLVNVIAHGAANVRILATSREALRAHGEHVHALGPLDVPASSAALTAKGALGWPAAVLFVEAAQARSESFRLDDENARFVGDICRKLDGIPLALELAAAMTDFMTVRELAERLDDRFTVLTRGRRTAPPRHRTMLDALEWGHTLLSSAAATTMRRLSVFPARFGLKDAVSVASNKELSASQVLNGVAELQSKSLLTVDISGDAAEFRFLETIRAFAAAKLIASNEGDAILRSHALHVLDMLTHLRQHKGLQEERKQGYRRIIDDLRTAHNWAVRPQGDRRIALHLLSVSSAVWRALNLETEFISRARETLVGLPDETPDTVIHELNLQLAMALALSAAQQVSSASFQRLYLATATRALELANRAGTATDRIRAISALMAATIEAGQHNALLAHVATLEGLLASSPDGRHASRSTYLRGLASHSVGRFAESMRIMDAGGGGDPRSPAIVAASTHSLASRALIARNLWLQGEMAAAREMREEGMAMPLGQMDPNEVLFFLTSCGVSFPLWHRDMIEAQRAIEILERIAVETGKPGFASFAPTLRAARDRLQKSGGSYGAGPIDWSPATTALADAMTGIHCSFHRPADLERIRIEPNWAAAEHLRSGGEHALIRNDEDCDQTARKLFDESRAVAAEQGALFWELRAAISKARLYRRQENMTAARQTLARVVARFDYRETCADLVDAKALLSN